MRNDPNPLEVGPPFTPERPAMPSAMRLKLDLRIHRQRLALRENWQIVDDRLWARFARPRNKYLEAALRLMRENRALKAQLAEVLSAKTRQPDEVATKIRDDGRTDRG